MPKPAARHQHKRPERKPNPAVVPEITYIVSAFNRPLMLPVALWSIAGQGHQHFNCYVADNSDNDRIANMHRDFVGSVQAFSPGKFHYLRTAKKIKVSDCYWAAEWVVNHMPVGTWLCFPCDDTYLVPDFAQRLLIGAYKENADFVYAKNIVCGPAALGGPDTAYAVWTQRLHRTAKTSFLVRTETFRKVGGFQGKMDKPGTVNADYFFSTQMVSAGVAIACVPEVLLVHN